MIEPGLARISQLIKASNLLPYTWRAIHVAGTNGKGSICAGISASLHAAGVRCGRYTSPHLIDRWDSICVQEQAVAEDVFHDVEKTVEQRDTQQRIGATEFEKLTATAFEIFERAKLDIAVIETGMGGRLDATNVFDNPLVTVISKIGLDHREFLGGTIKEIAAHKAGIMKKNVPCLIDATNDQEVKNVLLDHARKISAGECIFLPSEGDAWGQDIWESILQLEHQGDGTNTMEQHQKINLCLAVAAARIALSKLAADQEVHRQQPFNLRQMISAAKNMHWPGRLQCLSIEPLTGRKEDVLLDGAHNAQSAAALASYVDRRLRAAPRRQQCAGASPSPELNLPAPKATPPAANIKRPITWLLSASKHKNLQEIFSPLLKPGDNVVITEFGPVDGMPWVQPLPAVELEVVIKDILKKSSDEESIGSSTILSTGTDILRGLKLASRLAQHTTAVATNDDGSSTAEAGDGNGPVARKTSTRPNAASPASPNASSNATAGASVTTNTQPSTTADQGEENPLVATGSLYLVGDVLRLLRSCSADASRAGGGTAAEVEKSL